MPEGRAVCYYSGCPWCGSPAHQSHQSAHEMHAVFDVLYKVAQVTNRGALAWPGSQASHSASLSSSRCIKIGRLDRRMFCISLLVMVVKSKSKNIVLLGASHCASLLSLFRPGEGRIYFPCRKKVQPRLSNRFVRMFDLNATQDTRAAN